MRLIQLLLARARLRLARLLLQASARLAELSTAIYDFRR
jgi:hypothetical protein